MKSALFCLAIVLLLTGCSADTPSQITTQPPVEITPPLPGSTVTPQQGSVEGSFVISENNDGSIRLGMTKSEVIEIFDQYEIPFTQDEYGNFSTDRDDLKYMSFDDEGKAQYILATADTQKGLKIGDRIEDMERVYGEYYYDIGAGPGEDTFAYPFDRYAFLVDFFDHDSPVVTSWKITTMMEFTEISEDLLEPTPTQSAGATPEGRIDDNMPQTADSTPSAGAIAGELTDNDKVAYLGDAAFSLGMSMYEAMQEADRYAFTYRILKDGSMAFDDGLSLHFGDDDIVNRMKLTWDVATSARGLKRGDSRSEMLSSYGNDYETEISQHKGTYTTYLYRNDEIIVSFGYFDGNFDPDQIDNFDIYYANIHPIYK